MVDKRGVTDIPYGLPVRAEGGSAPARGGNRRGFPRPLAPVPFNPQDYSSQRRFDR